MILMKKLLSLTFLILTFTFISEGVFAQYKIVQDNELEKLIYQNRKSGKSNNYGLYTLLVFSVKDNDVLNEKFNELKFALTSVSKIESIELNKIDEKLEVIIDREVYNTVDFIKIFKNVVSGIEIKFIKYDETILARAK